MSVSSSSSLTSLEELPMDPTQMDVGLNPGHMNPNVHTITAGASAAAAAAAAAAEDSSAVLLTKAGVPRKKPGRKPGAPAKPRENTETEPKPKRTRKPKDPAAQPIQRKRKVPPTAVDGPTTAVEPQTALAAAAAAGASMGSFADAARQNHVHSPHQHVTSDFSDMRRISNQSPQAISGASGSGSQSNKIPKREAVAGSIRSLLHDDSEPYPVALPPARPSRHVFDPVRGSYELRDSGPSTPSSQLQPPPPHHPVNLGAAAPRHDLSASSLSVHRSVIAHHTSPPKTHVNLASKSPSISSLVDGPLAQHHSYSPVMHTTTTHPRQHSSTMPAPTHSGSGLFGRLHAASPLPTQSRMPTSTMAAPLPAPSPPAPASVSRTPVPAAPNSKPSVEDLAPKRVPEAAAPAPVTVACSTVPVSVEPAPAAVAPAPAKPSTSGKAPTKASTKVSVKTVVRSVPDSKKQVPISPTALNLKPEPPVRGNARTSNVGVGKKPSAKQTAAALAAAAAKEKAAKEKDYNMVPPVPESSNPLDFGRLQLRDVQGTDIVLKVELNGEPNQYVNFRQLVEETYGPEALNPRAAAQRDRRARIAAATSALVQAAGGSARESGDEVSDVSEGENSGAAGGAGGDGKPAKKKRNYKEDEYDKDDGFVDDSEMLWEEQAAASKDGFFVYSGPLVSEVPQPVEDALPKRGRGSRGGRASKANTRGGTGAASRGGATGRTSGAGPRGGGQPRKRLTKAEKEQREREERDRLAALANPAPTSA